MNGISLTRLSKNFGLRDKSAPTFSLDTGTPKPMSLETSKSLLLRNAPSSKDTRPEALQANEAKAKQYEEEAAQAARDFEGIFILRLLRTMRASVPKVGMLDNSFASNMYEQMFDENLSAQLAQGKGLGLGEMLYREFMRRENQTGRSTFSTTL
jgi:flagellar protein FlgJ